MFQNGSKTQTAQQKKHTNNKTTKNRKQQTNIKTQKTHKIMHTNT